MFSFPTHLLVGAALSYLFGFSMLFGALGGLAPDIDYFTPWHRGPFHSIAVAAASAAVIYAATRSVKKSAGFGIGFAAHSVADWANYIGVMIAWPFSSEFLRLDIATWDDPLANAGLSLISVLVIVAVRKRRGKMTWRQAVVSFIPERVVKLLNIRNKT